MRSGKQPFHQGVQGNEAGLPAAMLGIPLDSLSQDFKLDPPNHIKLDVDGGELEVLRGRGHNAGQRRGKNGSCRCAGRQRSAHVLNICDSLALGLRPSSMDRRSPAFMRLRPRCAMAVRCDSMADWRGDPERKKRARKRNHARECRLMRKLLELFSSRYGRDGPKGGTAASHQAPRRAGISCTLRETKWRGHFTGKVDALLRRGLYRRSSWRRIPGLPSEPSVQTDFAE